MDISKEAEEVQKLMTKIKVLLFDGLTPQKVDKYNSKQVVDASLSIIGRTTMVSSTLLSDLIQSYFVASKECIDIGGVYKQIEETTIEAFNIKMKDTGYKLVKIQ